MSIKKDNNGSINNVYDNYIDPRISAAYKRFKGSMKEYIQTRKNDIYGRINLVSTFFELYTDIVKCFPNPDLKILDEFNRLYRSIIGIMRANQSCRAIEACRKRIRASGHLEKILNYFGNLGEKYTKYKALLQRISAQMVDVYKMATMF